MRRAILLFLAAACAAACSSTTGLELPIVGRARPFVPVEGIERPELSARARGYLLSGRGEKPIQVRKLPGTTSRDHPIRGEIIALAGPALDGTFVYAVRDERSTPALRRGNVDGRDDFLMRFAREIHALALSPDAARIAVLAPFEEDDPRALGGSVRELVLVDVAAETSLETGFAAFATTPAWIDADAVACAVPTSDGRGEIRAFDARTSTAGGAIAPGQRVVRGTDGTTLLVFDRKEGDLDAARFGVDGSAGAPCSLRGVLEPLALLDADLLIAFSSPTLGAEPQWELELLEPQVALATIKIHDLATGDFSTLDQRASPRRLWSAGRVTNP